jgi:hypothetical protein
MAVYNKKDLKKRIIILSKYDIVLDDSINKQEFIESQKKFKLKRNIV